ncbi:MAG: hypothetical protein IPF79_02355 [Ignavibacteria bacterium]|nr:hypothetical protein [Ignavibacteria bacterium]
MLGRNCRDRVLQFLVDQMLIDMDSILVMNEVLAGNGIHDQSVVLRRARSVEITIDVLPNQRHISVRDRNAASLFRTYRSQTPLLMYRRNHKV